MNTMFQILQANLSSPSSTVSDNQLVCILLFSHEPILENSDLSRQLWEKVNWEYMYYIYLLTCLTKIYLFFTEAAYEHT